jgi:hypothetical protein
LYGPHATLDIAVLLHMDVITGSWTCVILCSSHSFAVWMLKFPVIVCIFMSCSCVAMRVLN